MKKVAGMKLSLAAFGVAVAAYGCLATLGCSGAFAGTSVWPYKMNPRLHPDDGRRTYLPPGPETLGEKPHFTMPFRDLGGKDWRAGLDASCRANLGDFIWSHNNVLACADLEERLAEVKRRGLYLFDLWGYVPGNGDASDWKQTLVAPEALRCVERVLGDHWLGVDNGEQDGRWVTYADQAQPYGADRFSRYLQFHRHFERLACDLGDGKMAALVGLMYGHYFLKENNYAMVGAETAQSFQNAQLFYAAIRGAGKQYGVPWFGNVSVYGRLERSKSYPRKKVPPPNAANGPWGGPSLALMKKLMYAQLFYNCSLLGFEGEQCWSDGTLTPIGRIQRDLMDWSDRYGDPGTHVAPIAVMTDFYAGWTVPRIMFTSFHYCVWGQTPYDEGDFFTDLVFDKLYPGYADSAFHDDERGYSAPTPYGDGADFLLSDAPAWLLARYPLLVVAGKVTPGEEIRDVLTDYVRGGGHLVLPCGNAEALFPNGVPSGRVTVIPGAAWGYDPATVAGEPRRQGMMHPRPYRLTPEADKALDEAFRAMQIVSVSPRADGGNLAFATCRRAAGEYTVLVSNNAWEERPLAIAARLGKLLSVEELPFGTSERMAEGCVPFSIWTNKAFKVGTDTDRTIAAGATRAFRVKIDEAGAVRELERQPMPALPKGRLLALRGAGGLTEQLLARPTFARHADGVLADARRLLACDDEALAEDGRYCARQHYRVTVDASDLCNHFLDLRFIEHNSNETARTEATLRKLFAKMDALGAKELVIAAPLMKHIPKTTTADDLLVAAFAKIARQAAVHGVNVAVRPARARYQPWYRRDIEENVRAAGAPNLMMAQELAVWADGCRDLTADETRKRAAETVAKYRNAIWLLAGMKRDVNRAKVSTCEPLASLSGAGAEAVRIWCAELKRQGVRVAYDAWYPDQDAEYRDFRLFESVDGGVAMPRIVAHRGGTEAGHENCLSAFRASLAAGVTGFELDARMTKDGELVVLHDGDLKRCVPGETRRAEDMTAAEFTALTYNGTDEHLPTLREVLALFKGRKGISVEIEMKSNHRDFYQGERLAEYCRKLRGVANEFLEPGTYTFISFYGSALDEMHRQDPDAPTTYIIYKDFTEKDVDNALKHHAKRLAVKLSSDGKVPEPSFGDKEKARRLCGLARAKGVDITMWMVETAEMYRLAAEMGAVSVTANKPKALERVIGK